MPVHPYVRCVRTYTYVRPQKISSISMKCRVRSRRVMHDGMQYDSIEDQGHKPFKVGNPAVFKWRRVVGTATLQSE